MQHILESASYVRNDELLQAAEAKQSALHAICERDATARHVWELLDTPQTVATLARRLKLDEGEPVDANDITASLTALIREELIQISPDS